MSIRSVLPFFLLSFMFAWACAPDSLLPADRTAPVHIYLTDDPGDFQEVNIDLLQVRIKTKATQGFVDLNTNAGVYNLLAYQAGQDTLIVNDSLPHGEIQEIRLVLGPDNSVMVDSVLHNLDTPSGQSSGLKIKFNKVLVQDSLNTVTLDFDAEKSVNLRGNGTYSLKPVIRVLP